jgi:integrase
VTAEVAPLIAPASSALNPKITSEPAASDPAATLPAKRAEDSSSQATPAPGDEANQSAVDVVLQLTPQDAMDFLLHPAEVARGRTAAEKYLNTCRNEESRLFAEEALETLATVISGGHCNTLEFPWQQVRPFHSAAALTILKEKGAPQRIETLRCRRDTTRSYRVVPENYPPGQVQKIRTTLTRVIAECSALGFVPKAEELLAPNGKPKSASKKTMSAAGRRLLGDGELRALSAVSTASHNAEGSRDAVFFALVCRGLKIADITGLTLESVRFSNKTGVCSIVSHAGSKGPRGRRVELANDELICLEDWLDHRGNADGPLLCTVGRGGKIEGKRLTTAILKEVCERRGKQADVADFVPNDLSRSAEELVQYRKTVKKRAAKQPQHALSTVEELLFASATNANPPENDGEAIRFPFLGLGS